MSKVYVLQKDLPDIKAGANGVVNENGLLCFYEDELMITPEYYFPEKSYENNPEWFKLKDELVRPPLGVMPEKLWKEHRLSDLHEAVKRYREVNKDIPETWQDEINSLHDWLKVHGYRDTITFRINHDEDYIFVLNKKGCEAITNSIAGNDVIKKLCK